MNLLDDHAICPLCASEDVTIIDEEYDIGEGYFKANCRCLEEDCGCGFAVYCSLDVIDIEITEC